MSKHNSENWVTRMSEKDPKGYVLATILFIPLTIGFLYFFYRMIF